MNWASIVKTEAPKPKAAVDEQQQPPRARSEVIVDTNALIRGVHLERFACRAVTVQEVLQEVRDKKSRAWLDRMPFGVDIEEADEEDIRAVTKFARATGDLSFLSSVDLKVISLTRKRQRSINREHHIKEYPGQVKIQPGGSSAETSQPGWGTVPNPEDWKLIDELNQLEEDRRFGKVESHPDAAENSSITSGSTGSEVEVEDTQETAAIQAAYFEDPNADNAASGRNSSICCEDIHHHLVDRNQIQNLTACSASEQGSEASDEIYLRNQELESLQDSLRTVGVSEHCNLLQTDSESHGCLETHSRNPVDSQLDGFEMGQGGIVACMTSDFSMQNVLIQMGLQVLTPDGRRIQKVKKWGMRCSACFHVTKQVGRIFCPNCGNASLQRVELCTQEDGTEVFGVRKKHILRGTRYSLPMPKGGNKNKDPILSEDMLKLRTKHINTPNKVNKSMDPFSPEFSEDTWFKISAAKHQFRDLLPNRRNPNERKRGKRRK